MRLAISNIAWDVSEDETVASFLSRHSIDAIDVAPGKYFPASVRPNDRDIAEVKNWWADRGIEITGMQSLLFGTTGLNVFGPAAVQVAMLQHLSEICRIGAGLGATRLVFGSPTNRNRSGLTDDQAIDIAVSFFRRLGDLAEAQNVITCLEPNPSRYGANFMTTSEETARVVEYIAHPAIRLQLDAGALTINREDASSMLAKYSQLIGHVHASEPDLLPLGDGGTDHRRLAAALKQYLPDHLVTIEMLATKDEPHLTSIKRSLSSAIANYQGRDGAIQ